MNAATIKAAGWFLPVAGLALVWNLLGVAAYLSQMMMNLSTLPESQRAFYAAIPAWATSAFAIAVFAGVVGVFGLLLKKRWALGVLVVSVLGIIVQMSYSLLIGNGLEVFGASALVLPLVTLAIGLGLVWLAVFAKKKGWLDRS